MTEGYSFFFSLFSRKIVETFEVRYCSVPLLIFMHLCLASAGQAISEPGTDHLDAAGRDPDQATPDGSLNKCNSIIAN